jgi:hypothetical protein
MQTPRVEVERVMQGRSRWLLVGIAAVGQVGIGGLASLQIDDDSRIAAAPTPIDIATAYLEAYAAFDVEAVASMLADDAEVRPWEAHVQLREWEPDLRYLQAAGFLLIIGECREQPSLSEGSSVECPYKAQGLGSDQIGEGPFGGSSFRLVVADGHVVWSDMGFNFSEFGSTMWFPFQNWILENHPGDYAVLYVDEFLSRQTDDAIALWEERVADYVEYVDGQP